MKPLRLIAFIAGGLILLLGLVVALAFVPAIQTWAVRKAVANQPDMTIDVDRVSVGLSSATISGLKVTKAGVVITADQVDAAYSAMDYFNHKRVNVDYAVVQGLVVDLRHPVAPAPASVSTAKAPAPAFDGALNQAKLPLEVRVAKFTVEGRALLSADRTTTFTVQGSDIGTDKDGKIGWKIEYADAAKNVPVTAVATSGSATFHIASDLRVTSLAVEANASARGAGLPADSVRLGFKAQQPNAGGNETYDVSVGLVRQEKLEPLFNSHTDYQAATHTLAGTWDIAIASGQLASLLNGFGLPEVAAKGSGKFTSAPNAKTLSASGSLQVDLSALEKLSPALAAVGAVHVQSAFDTNLAGDVARLERFNVTVTDASQRQLAEITGLQSISFDTVKKRLTLTDAKAPLARIAVKNLPLAWAQSFAKPMTIDSGDLSLAISIEADADGSHVSVKSIEPVTLRAVTISNGSQKLLDQATLTVQPHIEYSAEAINAELAGFKFSMPAGDTVEGNFSANVTHFSTAPVVAFTAQLQGKLAAALKPYLPLDPGPLTFTTSAKGSLAGQKLQLDQASTKVERNGNTLLLSFATQQAMSVDLKTLVITTPKPDSPTARIQLGEIPLSWGEAFVPKSKLAGSLAESAFDLSVRSADDVSFKTIGPVSVRGLSATINGQALAQALDVAVDFSGAKKGNAISYNVRQLELKQGTLALAKLVVAGEAKLGTDMTVSAKGTMDADLAATAKQPALAALATLTKGNVTTTFDVTSGKSIQAKASLKVSNLVAKQNNAPLGTLEVNVDANVTTDGSGRVKLPIVLTAANNRRSDISIDGTVTRSATAVSFEGKLTSDQLFADDFQALAALAPTAPAPATATPKTPAPTAASPAAKAAPAGKDTVAFWNGVSGKFEADLKKVQVGTDYVISGIKGRFAITDTRLGIDTLEGQLKGNPFKIAGDVTFAAKSAKPYTLAGTVNVTNFDVGEFLRAAKPNEKPQLESKVSIVGKANGTGLNLGDLVQASKGQFDVTGSSGVLRALGRKGDVASLTSKALGIVGTLKGSDNANALAALTAEFNEMPFDQFKVHGERGANLDLNVTGMEFISPTMRVTGTGKIEHQANVSIMDQPLTFEIQIAGKGTTERVFNQANLLAVTQGRNGNAVAKDEKGYSLVKTKFTVTGTPSNPDSSQIWKFFLSEGGKAAIAPALEGLLKGFGRE